jgi:hypothetical protein
MKNLFSIQEPEARIREQNPESRIQEPGENLKYDRLKTPQ